MYPPKTYLICFIIAVIIILILVFATDKTFSDTKDLKNETNSSFFLYIPELRKALVKIEQQIYSCNYYIGQKEYELENLHKRKKELEKQYSDLYNYYQKIIKKYNELKELGKV